MTTVELAIMSSIDCKSTNTISVEIHTFVNYCRVLGVLSAHVIVHSSSFVYLQDAHLMGVMSSPESSAGSCTWRRSSGI